MTYTITGSQLRLLVLGRKGFAPFPAVTQEALDTEYLCSRDFLREEGGQLRLTESGLACLAELRAAGRPGSTLVD